MPAPQRTVRIEDDIWDPAQERAKAEGTSLALMRAAVEGQEHKRDIPESATRAIRRGAA